MYAFSSGVATLDIEILNFCSSKSRRTSLKYIALRGPNGESHLQAASLFELQPNASMQNSCGLNLLRSPSERFYAYKKQIIKCRLEICCEFYHSIAPRDPRKETK